MGENYVPPFNPPPYAGQGGEGKAPPVAQFDRSRAHLQESMGYRGDE